ncbi:MAG TPA: lactate utilization protein [Spirochaetia bacterium]|nr:lactate utilization protein [Spirochaetia bacterium]
MEDVRQWHRDVRVEKALKALKKNGFATLLVSSKKEATDKILEIIPEGVLVGLGGSLTVREIGLPAALTERGNRVADHWEAVERKAPPEEIAKIRKLHPNSDVFVCSTNALTEEGELVNIDGAGQRVAAMIYGPGKVIVVAGVNKIVRDLDEAIDRVRDYAAPINARRLNKKTPCATGGYCTDCDSPERICNITTIIHKKPQIADITVVIVEEELGY